MSQLLQTVLGSLAVAYVSLCLLLLVQEKSFIFFPEPYPGGGDWGLPERMPDVVEDVVMKDPQGHTVHGWAFNSLETDRWLLYLHGNAGNLAGRSDWCLALRELPANVLIIDYPTYGKSTGTLDEAGVYTHAETAYRWLRETRGVPPEKIVLYGKSLGGGPAAEMAVRHPSAGLIMQSTFTSVPAMGKRMFPFLPVDTLARTRFDNLAKVRKLELPKLFLHARPDEVVPFEMGETLHREAAEPRTWKAFEGSGHNDLVHDQRDAVLALFREFLDGLEAR